MHQPKAKQRLYSWRKSATLIVDRTVSEVGLLKLASIARKTFARSQGAVIEGWIHPSFAAVAESLRQQITAYGGGGAVCVFHHGECVVDIWGGIKGRAGQAWSRDTMAPSFSTTKGVAATLLHILVDQGLLDYDDYVAKYWPEFGQAGKE